MIISYKDTTLYSINSCYFSNIITAMNPNGIPFLIVWQMIVVPAEAGRRTLWAWVAAIWAEYRGRMRVHQKTGGMCIPDEAGSAYCFKGRKG